MSLAEATKCILTILKQVMEEKLSATNVEVATITPAVGYHMYSKEEVEQAIRDVA